MLHCICLNHLRQYAGNPVLCCFATTVELNGSGFCCSYTGVKLFDVPDSDSLSPQVYQCLMCKYGSIIKLSFQVFAQHFYGLMSYPVAVSTGQHFLDEDCRAIGPVGASSNCDAQTARPCHRDELNDSFTWMTETCKKDKGGTA